MAVLQPGAYEGIYEMLKQRAEQERNQPKTPLQTAAQGVGQAVGAYAGSKIRNKMDADQEKDLGRFKLGLEKELARYKDEELEGIDEYTQEDINNYFKSTAGIEDPKFVPQLPKGKIKATPEKIQTLLEKGKQFVAREKLADQVATENPDLAAYIRAYPEEGKAVGEKLFPQQYGKMEPVADPASPTGAYWATRDKSGNIKLTDFPAPKEALSGRSNSMLSPQRRTDELTKQYETRVKDINFIKYEDAYGVAKRSEKVKPTSASDTRLLYAYAKMLQPTGVLTDQDFNTAVNNGSFGEEAIRMVNKPGEGNVLSPAYRKKISDEIVSQYGKVSEQLTGIEEQFTRRAEEEGLNVKDVVRDVRSVERSIKENSEAEELLKKAGKKITPEALEVAKKVLKKKKSGKK